MIGSVYGVIRFGIQKFVEIALKEGEEVWATDMINS